MPNLNVGIVVSTEGSAFRSVFEITKESGLGIDFFVALDRNTSLVDYCVSKSIPFAVFDGLDNRDFSIEVAHFFKKSHVSFCFLFLSRLITEELFVKIETINLHPSLLPKFPGMNAIKNYCNSEEDFFGLTAHLVDNGIDTGPKVLQVSLQYSGLKTVESLRPISYLQKVLATLLIIESNLFPKDSRPIQSTTHFRTPQLEESFGSCFADNTLRNYLSRTVISRYAAGHE